MSTSSTDLIFIVHPDGQVCSMIDRVLHALGYDTRSFTDWSSASHEFTQNSPDLVILSERLREGNGLDLARNFILQYPTTPVLLLFAQETPEQLKQAMRLGVSHFLRLPLRVEEILMAVQESLAQSKRRREWAAQHVRRNTTSLERRVTEMETLTRLGRTITSQLDSNSVLSAVIDAAVELTSAEEGSLMLVDDKTGELYIRAARNFSEEMVHTFRVPIHDSLAGSVVTSGEAAVLDEKTPKKIKTSYLVKSLIYVPLKSQQRVIGVLGVDNRNEGLPFKDHDVRLLMALAEFAVIALENARLYDQTIQDRNNLDTILRSIQDGVIVLDEQSCIMLINQVALHALQVDASTCIGAPASKVFNNPELIALIQTANPEIESLVELTTLDGRVFNAQIANIQGIGQAVTLHDITHLKRLDRVKNEFVNTVSHDLRSPLTAILGYSELIERSGPLNEMQVEFLHRVQSSANSITVLVNDLLNLGRIEAGFDNYREPVYLNQLLRFSVDGLVRLIQDRGLTIKVQTPDEFPDLYANPVQMRQMIDNLLDNAVKYTAPGGTINASIYSEGKQIILQIKDTGIGIPPKELPYIFDKFFRASNIRTSVTNGTGLGLAIVRSIVEAHQGRIWVDSTLGSGTTFTVVLPIHEIA